MFLMAMERHLDKSVEKQVMFSFARIVDSLFFWSFFNREMDKAHPFYDHLKAKMTRTHKRITTYITMEN